MENKKRKIMFYSFIVAFVFVGIYLVAITQGISMDWNNLIFMKTGAIYVRSNPSNPNIFINGKFYKSEDGIMNKGTLVKNLPAGLYEVSIEREGYHTWKKTLSVEKGMVSSESFIKLWEKNPETEIVASSSVVDFWVVGKEIITQDKKGIISLGEKLFIKGREILDYSPYTGAIITKEKNGEIFFINISELDTSINIKELFNSLKQRELGLPGIVPIEGVFSHPFSPSKAIIHTKSSVYMLDFKKVSLEKILDTEKIESTFVDSSGVFVKNTKGEMIFLNLLIKGEQEILFSTSTEILSPKFDSSRIFFIDGEKSLFSYDRSLKRFEKIASGVKKFSLSPEGKRIAILFENGTVGIYYVGNYVGNEIMKEETMFLLLPDKKMGAGQFTRIEWAEKFPYYLVLYKENTVWALEADQRNPQNTIILFDNVKKYSIEDDFYVLFIDGTLKKIAF